MRGRSRNDLREGYWSARVERHVAFYTVSDSTIRTQRLLHKAMDAKRHL